MERFAGRYELVRSLGQGGMGTVWLVRDLSNGTECVLKRLAPDTPHVAPGSLRREFELLARVRHPSVVSVHELGFSPDGAPYLTMEYVPGIAADKAERAWDTESLCFVAARVAQGLEALHAAGVVHGDLKPSNLLLLPSREGETLPAGVRMLDFGLASLLGRDVEGHRGTPGFAAPEVVRGEAPGVASDLYGLGAMLYALAARRVTPEGADAVQALRRQQSAAPPAAALEEAGLSGALVRLVLRLMAPVASERPNDAREVRRELERIHPIARRSLTERLQSESLTGRERELARIERWLVAAPEGPPLVLVGGEPGIGKSALLTELGVRSTLAGRSAIGLHCAQADAPGAVAIAVLRRLAAEAGGTDEQVHEWRPALELLERGDAAAIGAAIPAIAHAASRWCAALAERGRAPVVLLDDCERMDSLSHALLRATALQEEAATARWVWARRTDGAPAQPEDRMLVRAGQAVELALGALDRANADRLAAARLHEEAPEALREFLWTRSGGHPGLLVEALLAAADAGVLREHDAGIEVDAGALASLPLPEGFEASLLRRLGALSEGARALAEALATLDRPVTLETARSLAAAADGTACDALVHARLAVRGADARVSLHPPELSRRLLAALAPERRCELHRAALGLAGATAAERFRHFEGAGDTEQALSAARAAVLESADDRIARRAAALAEKHAPALAAEWHETAGRLLLERGKHREAIAHLERALRDGGDTAVRGPRWTLLSTALLRADRPADVGAVVERALSEQPPAAERAALLVNHASQFFSRGQLPEAERHAREALAEADAADDAKAIGYASLTLGSVVLALGRLEEADACVVGSLAGFERAEHEAGAVRALVLRAMVANARGDEAAFEGQLTAARARAASLGLRLATEEILGVLAGRHVEAGRWKDAEEALSQALRLALQDGRPRGAAVAYANLALVDAVTGRAGRARHRARIALRLTRAYLPRLEPFAWRVLAHACRIMGRLGPADRAARTAISGALRLGLGVELDWARLEYGRVRAAAGAWPEAEAVWARALESAGTREGASVAMLVVARGRAQVRRGDFGAASASLARAEDWLAGRATPYVAAHARLLGAELELAQGRAEAGVAAAREALAAFATLATPAERAHAALECSRLAAAAAVVAPVDEWLDLAAGAFERLGDHRGRERALALAVEWLRAGRGAPVRHEGRGLLDSVSRLLDSLSDPGELTRRAMQLAVEQLDAERGVLLLVDEKSGALVPVVERGAVDAATRDQAVTYSRQAVARVAASGDSLLIPDAKTDPGGLSASMVDLRLRSIVCVPFYRAGRVVGAVYLDDSRRSLAFSDADRALLEGFAHLVAIALEKSRGQEEERRRHERLAGENVALRAEAGVRFQPQNFVGLSAAMQRVLALAERASQTGTTVLITGENGTGKERIARIIHHTGRRASGPFVSVNCGAIPQTLLESELFGILPNVATGVRGREGRFVQADGGTLFLDEIGDMPLPQQVALLTALSTREITPVGGGEPVAVDVRIIAATNQDLRRKIESGTFREDLFYRLNVLPIEVPPLRERKADIPALAHGFASHFARQQEREVPELAPDFLAALMQSDWPGNVRELQNYVERVMAMTPGRVLHPHPMPRDLENRAVRPKPTRGRKLRDHFVELEREIIHEPLLRSDGNKSKAARELGMTEQTLRYRLKKLFPEGRKVSRPRK
ncbi:MAG: sigma 54-interacting transcriptional regulator [Candidatus Eisenbacteria bacterium]|uniref:Sigma 54-interacting transcriptional regulator n=1 Tax=Eiseniibacteriota bacterium TaxID=2212470 RepID=A0A933SEQ6_UNCEI|nr:sigma 54-interacting transcriptional regulator [Candidatus Eisenbacteria bacterium]